MMRATANRFCPSPWVAGPSVALGLLVLSCSTPTTETSVWQNPGYVAGPMKRIAVFGGSLDEAQRHTVEDGFVSALASHGVQATPSYALFPDGKIPSDAAAIRSTLQGQGYDGSLVSTPRGNPERVRVTPDVAWGQGSGWGNGFFGANGGPGTFSYPETAPYVRFETTLWSPQTGKLVWSVDTETVNPKSGRDFVHSLTGAVVPALAESGLIPPGPPISFAP